jgi:hypothetical protein
MDNKTKRLGNRATKSDLRDAHRVKMEAKQIVNDHNARDAGYNKRHTFANLSVNHEYYGDTPQEHEARKNSA